MMMGYEIATVESETLARLHSTTELVPLREKAIYTPAPIVSTQRAFWPIETPSFARGADESLNFLMTFNVTEGHGASRLVTPKWRIRWRFKWRITFGRNLGLRPRFTPSSLLPELSPRQIRRGAYVRDQYARAQGRNPWSRTIEVCDLELS